MQYAILAIEDEAAFESRTDEQRQPAYAGYQPYWAVRADLLRRAGDHAAAAAAYTTAVGLTDDVAVRRFLLARRAVVG